MDTSQDKKTQEQADFLEFLNRENNNLVQQINQNSIEFNRCKAALTKLVLDNDVIKNYTEKKSEIIDILLKFKLDLNSITEKTNKITMEFNDNSKLEKLDIPTWRLSVVQETISFITKGIQSYVEICNNQEEFIKNLKKIIEDEKITNKVAIEKIKLLLLLKKD